MFNAKILEKSMLALKNKDDSGFKIIYEETHRLVYYIIFSIIKNKEEAEDLMQEVYMKVYEKIDQYNHSPKAWIGRIARNLAINRYHKIKREKVSSLDSEDISRLKTSDERTPLIDLASKILAEDEFQILMLCVVEKYKRREVGKLMNLSTSGVTWKLNNALEKLRKELEDES